MGSVIDNSCAVENTYTQEQLDIRRKAEILQYKNNSTRLTKREKYARESQKDADPVARLHGLPNRLLLEKPIVMFMD